MSESNYRPPEPPPVREDDPDRSAESQRDLKADHPVMLNGTPTPSPNMIDAADLKRAQTLVMVASIAGPVSLFIGGVLLSTVGLVCALIAFRKLTVLAAKHSDIAVVAARLKRSSIIGLAVCGIALVLNAVSLYLMLPVVLEMMETGDYAGMMADTGSGVVGSNSTWG